LRVPGGEEKVEGVVVCNQGEQERDSEQQDVESDLVVLFAGVEGGTVEFVVVKVALGEAGLGQPLDSEDRLAHSDPPAASYGLEYTIHITVLGGLDHPNAGAAPTRK
jgi:hypothetical protein